MRAILAILICLLSLSVRLRATEPRQQVEAFLAAVVAGKIDAAYDGLFKGSCLLESRPQQVEEEGQRPARGLAGNTRPDTDLYCRSFAVSHRVSRQTVA